MFNKDYHLGVARRKPANTIIVASMQPDIAKTLQRWRSANLPGVLIGGTALSFYVKPRYTQDIDVLLTPKMLGLFDSNPIPSGFIRHRTHALEDKSNGVEVELVTAKLVGIPEIVVDKVIESSSQKDGIKVASIEGLIALKLYGSDNPRRHRQDTADIISLLEENAVDMSSWFLTKKHSDLLTILRKEAST